MVVVAIVAGSLVGFVLIWLFVLFLVASLTGWRRLGSQYRTDRVPEGREFPAQSWYGKGSGRYLGAVDMAAAKDGLFMKMRVAFLRIAHPTLFIPWGEMREVERGKMLVRLEVGESAQMRIPIEVWDARVDLRGVLGR